MEAQRRGDTGRDTQRQRGEERCKTWGRTHGGTERERHRLGGRDRERHRDTGEGTESRVEGNDGQTETGCWRGAQAEWGGQEWGSCGGGQGPSGSPQTRLGLQGPLRITPGCGAPLLGGGGERRRAAGEGCPLHLGPSPSLHGGGALSVSPPPIACTGQPQISLTVVSTTREQPPSQAPEHTCSRSGSHRSSVDGGLSPEES